MARITVFAAAVVATAAAALLLMPLFSFTRGSIASFRTTMPDGITSNSGEADDYDNEVYNSSNIGTSSNYDVQPRWYGRGNRSVDLVRLPLRVLVADNRFLLSHVYDDLLIQSGTGGLGLNQLSMPIFLDGLPKWFDTNRPQDLVPLPGYVFIQPGHGGKQTQEGPHQAYWTLRTTTINVLACFKFISHPELCRRQQSQRYKWQCDNGYHGNPYVLDASEGNELILSGCNMHAMMVEHGNPAIISGCASFCSHNDTSGSSPGDGKYCCSNGCCKALISESTDGMPKKLVIKSMVRSSWFHAEEGWFNLLDSAEKTLQDDHRQKDQASENATEVPILFQRGMLLSYNGLSSANMSSSSQPDCDRNQAARDLCKSKQSHCKAWNIGYTCQCNHGYHGNPYIHDGCKGTIRIIEATIVAGLLLLALIAYFIYYNLKHPSTIFLKREYLKKNRKQLLQQLVPQRADIAEKMIMTLEDLEKATNNFDKAHELGRGGHAIVYKGILSDLYVVAIKKPMMVVQREIDEFINEVAILSQINHRNIVKLYGCCLETEVPLLVYEFISNGTLYGHLHVEGPRSLPWNSRLRIATEIAKALSYLHSAAIIPIIHRDVKPANILLDDTLTPKIADFGASRFIPLDRSGLTTMEQGTIGYLDPMYFRTCRLIVKSDVYSFGVVLIELMTRKKPFSYIDSEGNGLVAQFSTLFAEGSLSQVLDPQIMDEGGNKIDEIARIAVSCVKLRGEERPTMRQVEMRLEAAQPPEEFATNSPSTRDGGSREGLTSRQYSMEEEYMLSARYPR